MIADTILQGDIRQIAQTLPDKSVHCIVLSPPYYGLRDYGTAEWEGGRENCDHSPRRRNSTNGSTLDGGKKTTGHTQEPYRDTCPKCGAIRKDAQIGLEPTPQEYVETLVSIFRELRRVLRDDGTVWLNLGDSYQSSDSPQVPQSKDAGTSRANGVAIRPPRCKDLKPKDLIGIPWRVALALQADGWYLRSDIIWAKPNPMPESVTDRPTKAHEYIFLLSKSARYYYDAEAVREPHKEESYQRANYEFNGMQQTRNHPSGHGNTGNKDQALHPNGRNRRTVWTVATQPYPEAHFATFPPDLIRPCILAGCPERCCSECGAPWERVFCGSNPSKHASTGVDLSGGIAKTANPQTSASLHRNGGGVYSSKRYIGFEPTCACNAPTVPGVVFDPFLGSGTVAQVAIEEGRSWLGCELSADYIDLAWERIYAAKLAKVAGNGYAKQVSQEIDGYQQLGLINAE